MVLIGITGQSEARAQRIVDFSFTVSASAQNKGIFQFSLNTPNFDFSTVGPDGRDYFTPNVVAQGRNGADTGGVYESAPGAITWTSSAAPRSTVSIHLVSGAADHSIGAMPDDALEVQIQDAAGGTSTGYQPFTAFTTLISGMDVRNGSNSVTGDLDLRLTVLDTDPRGTNIWTVRLRALGNP